MSSQILSLMLPQTAHNHLVNPVKLQMQAEPRAFLGQGLLLVDETMLEEPVAICKVAAMVAKVDESLDDGTATILQSAYRVIRLKHTLAVFPLGHLLGPLPTTDSVRHQTPGITLAC